jgi:formate dehydrogenase subunit beta
MSKALKINKGIEEGIIDFLEFLIKSGKIKGVFTLKKMNEDGAVAYSLITSLDELKKAVPFYPFMPVNTGKVLSSFTLTAATEEPVAAVLRPCELRAFIELAKRVQGSLDNILLISLTCGGVFPLRSLKNGALKNHQPSYWETVKKAEIDPETRLTCQSCEDFVPQLADMTVATAGMKDIDKECVILLNTVKGEEHAASAPGNIITEKLENGNIEKLQKLREEKKKNIFEDFDGNHADPKAFIKTFAACVGCHACSHSCPICFCTLCDFDSKTCEYQPQSFLSELEQKNGLKVPPGNIFFHLGRMNHMAVSCVRCGMCSDVCPVNIPVATVFSRVGDSLQKVFNYIPGRDVKEPVPSGTYKEEEFAEFGEQ